MSRRSASQLSNEAATCPADENGYVADLKRLVCDLESSYGAAILRRAMRMHMERKALRYEGLVRDAYAAVRREEAVVDQKIPELTEKAGASSHDAWQIFESVSRRYLEACDDVTSMKVILEDAKARLAFTKEATDDTFLARRDALVDALHALTNYSAQPHIVNSVAQVVAQFLRVPCSIDSKFLNFLLAGASGTGKTSIVKAIANVFAKSGMFVYDRVRVAGRAELVGEYEGQTVARTRSFLVASLECVVFVDEAYSLTKWDDGRPESYGSEATTAMVEFMSAYKGLYSMFFAGYEKEMKRYFLPTNPGLVRRIPYRFKLSNLSTGDLVVVFQRAVSEFLGFKMSVGRDAHLPSMRCFTDDAWHWLRALVTQAHAGAWERADGGEFDRATRTTYPPETRFVPAYPKLHTLFENQAGSMVNLAEEAVTFLTNIISFEQCHTSDEGIDVRTADFPVPAQDRSAMRKIVLMRVRNTAMSNVEDFVTELNAIPRVPACRTRQKTTTSKQEEVG